MQLIAIYFFNAYTLAFLIFSQKEKAFIVERVVKFLACIVENWRKVRRQPYSTFVENACYNDTDTDDLLLFFFNVFTLSS